MNGLLDVGHCGKCDSPCAAVEVCVDGDCLGTCPDSGHVPCSGTCPDHATDPMHCGDCDVVCLVPDPATVGTCVAAECDSAPCPEGQWDYDGSPGNGCEYECISSGEEVCDGIDNDCDSFLDEESCDDGIACTVDVCNVQLGCQHTPAHQLCDEGNPCTAGHCDLDEGCSFEAVDGPCDDGNPCTAGDQCLDAMCEGTEVAECCLEDSDCDDGNVCTADACLQDSHVCANVAGANDLAPCDLDGDGCTLDQCLSGSCLAGPMVICPVANEQCHVTTCVADGPFEYSCEDQFAPEGTFCDDGQFCLIGESCDAAGQCVGGVERDCGQGLGDCLEVGCSEETDQCTGTPVEDGTECDADGDGCTQNDQCQQGLCFPGNAPDCPGDPANCTAGICVSLGATDYECTTGTAVVGTLCDDGQPCTEGEVCDEAGECGGGQEKVCEPSGILCVDSKCNENTGDCELIASEPGTPCDDDDACTMVSSCQGGQCVGSENGCVERMLNATTKVATLFPRTEQQETHHLGFGRSLTVWRAGDGDLRAQLLDHEGTKLLPDLPLTTTEWPPTPGNCGRALTRPAVAVRANGDWLVASGYTWREMYYSGCGSAWYKRLCNFVFHYGLGYAVYDRHGNLIKEWVPVITSKALWTYSTYYHGCNCGCTTGAYMPAINALGQDYLSAVSFTDGSFAIIVRIDGGAVELRLVTATLDPGNVITLGSLAGPSACSLADDHLLLVYEAAGQVYYRMLDKAGNFLDEAVAVADEEAGHQTQARCRALPDGGFLIGYSSGYDGGGADVFFRRFNAAGEPTAPAAQANQATEGAQFAGVAPAPLDDGSFVSVWHDSESGGQGYTARGRHYQDDLSPAGSEFGLGGNSVGGEQYPVAESLGNEWIATWMNPAGGSSHDVLFRRYDGQGTPVPGALERRVGVASQEGQGAGAIAALADGGLAIAWQFENGGPQDTDIALRLFDLSGSGLAAPVVANQTGQSLQYGVALTREPVANRLLVAWTSLGQFEGEDVVGRLFDPSGEPAGEEFRVNDVAANGQFGVSLATVAPGIVAAAWAGESGDESGTDILLRLFDGQGEPLTGDLQVAEDNANEQGPVKLAAVSEDDVAMLAAAWSTTAGGEAGGVFTRLFLQSGEPGSSAVKVAAGANLDQLAIDGQAGHYLVCWRAATEVVCRHLGPGLAPVGAQFTVEAEGNPARPAVLFRDDGSAWVVAARSAVDAEGMGIYRHHIDLTGNAKSPAALLNWGEAGDQQFPFATVLASGNVTVGWTGEGGLASELFFRILE